MSLRTNRFVLMLRDLGRKLGLNKLIAGYLLGGGYETRYDCCFSGALRLGDCVWDVGAKIDVEGFEYEVLEGLDEYIKNLELRLMGIEVHFSILKERGVPQVPQQIETLLQRHGFSVSWPDSSHIIAVRNA
jgi:Methyltransferase FkbM domain